MAIPKFFKNDNGKIQEAEIGVQVGGTADTVVVTGMDGKIDSSFLPTSAAEDSVAIYTVVSVETIAAGDLVNTFNEGGVAKIRKADASNGREAHGFCLTSFTSANGATAKVYFEGNNTAMSGLTVGKQWLSATQPGKTTTIPPSGTGQLVQVVGFASSATSMNFQSTNPFYLA